MRIKRIQRTALYTIDILEFVLVYNLQKIHEQTNSLGTCFKTPLKRS